MPANLSGPTLLVILFIVLLLFGAPKLPALARSLGQSMKILKKEVSTSSDDKGAESKSEDAVPAEPVAQESATDQELAKAKAEAEALRAEAQVLRAQAEESARRTEKTE